jgi:hypothetical protein
MLSISRGYLNEFRAEKLFLLRIIGGFSGCVNWPAVRKTARRSM